MNRLTSKFLFVLVFFVLPLFVSAGSEHNLSGWAWSSNVGWISFNSTNDHDSALAGVQASSIDYGVNKNSDGTLVGYAWSPAVGWIQFGGLSGFPTGSGTQAQNANINGVNVKGWIKAILADDNGWDGWVSLSGPSYGVGFGDNHFTGYAWGDAVIGWMLFDVQNVYPTICTDCGVKLGGNATLDVKDGLGATLSGRTDVPYNTIPTFEWDLTAAPGATCSVSKVSSGGTPLTTISNITSTGSTTESALANAAYTYQISCDDGTLKQTSFTVLPQAPGFTLGGTESARIQFVGDGPSESEQKTFFVNAVGGFSSDVSISISMFPTPPVDTTFLYSLGGSAYATTTPPVVISAPYTAGSTFRANVSKKVTNQYTVRITGTGGGLTATKDYIIDPTSFDPTFEEF